MTGLLFMIVFVGLAGVFFKSGLHWFGWGTLVAMFVIGPLIWAHQPKDSFKQSEPKAVAPVAHKHSGCEHLDDECISGFDIQDELEMVEDVEFARCEDTDVPVGSTIVCNIKLWDLNRAHPMTISFEGVENGRAQLSTNGVAIAG